MAPYRPTTKWPSVSIPWLAIVHRADPDFERRKHREPWFEDGQGRQFYRDPYKSGAYVTPSRTITVSYAGPQVFAAGDLTGVGYDFVTLISTNIAPGILTTRTAAQMFADIAGAVAGIGHALRVVNNATGAPLVLAPGAGVIFNDRSAWQVSSITLRRNTYSDLRVQFPTATDAVISVDSEGSPYSALVG